MTKLTESAIEEFACNLQILHVAFSSNCPEKSDSWKKPPQTLQIHNSTAEFLMFTSQAGENSIEVRVDEGSVWLMQKLIAELIDRDISVISRHLKNFFDTGELPRAATVAKSATV